VWPGSISPITAGTTGAIGVLTTPSPAQIGVILRVDADPEVVGQLAHRARVVLLELRAAEGAGLEEMSLELTATTQREGAAA
jgi:hypothetical protein